MFDPEKILKWYKMAQKNPAQDFWTKVFDSPQNTSLLEQISNMITPRKTFPYTDIYQTGQEIVVLIDLPGIKKQDIQIQIANDRLLIKGVAPESHYSSGLVSSERFTGKFERTINLPEMIAKTGYKASLRDGLLEIRLPRGYEATVRTIPIDKDE